MDELRRVLFEHLGGTVTRGAWDDTMHGYEWRADWSEKSDLEWFAVETEDEYWQQLANSLTTSVPDWSVDAGEALELCQQLATKYDYCLMMDWTHWPIEGNTAVMFVDIWYGEDNYHNPLNYSPIEIKGKTLQADAETLARALALLARVTLDAKKLPVRV